LKVCQGAKKFLGKKGIDIRGLPFSTIVEKAKGFD
jgi:hypothetical protein